MLGSFKFKDNKQGYQDFFIKVQATNDSLTKDAGSRPDWILRKVAAANPKNILEIGSQTGGVTRFLLDLCQDVTCIDIVPNQLDIVRAMGAKTYQCFAEDLHTLNLGKFDVVTITEVLNHALDADLAASNAWAKVAKGGHLIVTVPHGDRWIDQCVARRFDSDEDMAKLMRLATGKKSVDVERIMSGNEVFFYACDIQK